jgi:predicted RNA-binding protein YlxR (DUF448 family)
VLAVVTKQEKDGSDVAERTCAGCREVAEREDLFRFVHAPDNDPCLVPDLGGRLAGHGVWIHPRRSCLSKAVRGGFSRALKTGVVVDTAQLLSLAQMQIDRRVQGLLLAALRRRQVVPGTDAVREALTTGAPRLLLVAKDAAGRRDDLVQQANARRVPVVELSNKDALGRLTGKETLGFLAVLDAHIAREIAASARWLAGLSEDG